MPPLVLTGIEGLAAAVSPRLRRGLHLFFVAALTAAFGLQLLKDGPGGTAAVLIPIAVAIGLAGAAFYALSRIGP